MKEMWLPQSVKQPKECKRMLYQVFISVFAFVFLFHEIYEILAINIENVQNNKLNTRTRTTATTTSTASCQSQVSEWKICHNNQLIKPSPTKKPGLNAYYAML